MNNDKKTSSRSDSGENLAPSKAAPLVVDEARMLLPGIQALFGFQLIAVFNQVFSTILTPFEQRIHLLAIFLTVVTTIILITPAAYHRQMEVQDVTEGFINLATRLILASMIPLAISICLDFYLISRIILRDEVWSLVFSIGLLLLFFGFWFGLPRTAAIQRLRRPKH
jgi:hypothetical protein